MKSILIVDTSKIFLEYIGFVMARLGLHLSTATSGAEALDILKQRSFDLLMCEIRLPDTDGIELCKAVKADPQMSHTMVIIVSTEAGEEIQDHARRNGCVDYLTKPVKVRTLYLALERLLGHRRRMIRANMDVPVTYRHGTQTVSSRTLNIGEGGAFILSDKPLPVGSLVDVRLTLPGHDNSLSGEAEVVYVFGSKAEWHPAGMGLRFTDPDSPPRAVLSRYLEDYLSGPSCPES